MRKSFLQFAYMGAIALMSSVGFSACSDDKEDPGNSGNNINNVNAASEVSVNFIFNVAATSQANTRMTSEAAQANGSFRGMKDAHLFSFEAPTAGDWVTTPNAASMKKYYDLGNVLTSNEVNDIGTEASGGKSNRILTISLPTGVNSLMFYSRAAQQTATNPSAEYGKVDFSIDTTNPLNTSISYVQRLTNETKHQDTMWLLADALTEIVNSGVKNDDADAWFWWCPDGYNDGTGKKYILSVEEAEKLAYTDPIDTKTELFSELSPTNNPNAYKVLGGVNCYLVHYGLSWRQTGYDELANNDPTIPDQQQSVMGESLGQAYYQLTNIRTIGTGTAATTELRAGSGDAVLKTIQDVYGIVRHALLSKPNNASEAVAYKLAENINNHILRYFTADGYNLSYRATGAMISNVQAYIAALNTAGDTKTVIDDTESIIKYRSRSGITLSNTDELTTFPVNYGVPQGSSLLTFEYTDNLGLAETMNVGTDKYYGGTFQYHRTLPSYDIGVAAGVNVTDYVYPAELMYFGNSPIRTSNNILEVSQYPNGYQDWINNDMWSDVNQNSAGWSPANSTVSSTTRSVAMAQNINYGVALLKTRVNVASGDIEDNRHAITGEANKVVNPSNFELTGIIVGSQPNKVGWNYLTTTAPGTTVTWTSMIYDTRFNEGMGAIPTPDGKYNYTLTLDNYVHTNDNIANDTQNDVYVALEFKNNGDNFYAMHNLVRSGGTFYIVGRLRALAPGNFNTFTNWPKTGTPATYTYALPPYADGHTVKEVPRVLMQDYTTTVNFTLGNTSLQKAYITVPDLRSSQVSLGLSVDVKWETGLNFNVVLGDTN